MEYQVVEVKVHTDSAPVLALTKQEARCVESLADLVVGDKVVVVYVGEVCIPPASHIADSPLGVALEQPIIVKRASFTAFAERLMDFLVDPPAAQLPSGSDTPSVVKPT